MEHTPFSSVFLMDVTSVDLNREKKNKAEQEKTAKAETQKKKTAMLLRTLLSSFCSIEQQHEYLTLALDGILVHHRVTSQHSVGLPLANNLPVSYPLYTWVNYKEKLNAIIIEEYKGKR